VFRFYADLARQVPGVLWHSTNRVLSALGVVAFVLVLLNREWAQAILDWNGISPWWAVLAIAVLFVVLLAQANYEAFRGTLPPEATPNRQLADRLTKELKLGMEMRRSFEEENLPLEFTAQQVWGPIRDALDWNRRIETLLGEHAPEWLPEFQCQPYVPEYLDPEDVTVLETMQMLDARVDSLGRVVRGLRHGSTV
jgi:hypothetical protein